MKVQTASGAKSDGRVELNPGEEGLEIGLYTIPDEDLSWDGQGFYVRNADDDSLNGRWTWDRAQARNVLLNPKTGEMIRERSWDADSFDWK